MQLSISLDQIERPKHLIKAARYYAAKLNRKTALDRYLALDEHAPASHTLPNLREMEQELDLQRRSDLFTYRIEDHVAILGMLIHEHQLYAATHKALDEKSVRLELQPNASGSSDLRLAI